MSTYDLILRADRGGVILPSGIHIPNLLTKLKLCERILFPNITV